VDHEIHHHRVLLHARHERTEAPRLDQDRRGHDLLELVHRPVEALDVADVQDGAATLGHRAQLAPLLQRGRHRLFHQDADAGLQEIARHVEMLLGGHGHAGHVHAADQVSVIAERFGLVPAGDALGAVRIDVGHPDQLGLGQLGVDQHVVLPHVAGPDHPGAKTLTVCHQALTSSESDTASPSGVRGAPQIP
jgi:hypothetical protein